MVTSISKSHVHENKRDYSSLAKSLSKSATANQKNKTSLGNIFDLQSMELLTALKKMINCLDPTVDLYEDALDLIHLKDGYKSALFLIVASISMLHYEAAMSLSLIGILLAIQYNAYYRRVYQP